MILADEINRTTPRTQSALLEAMSDRQVSVEGKTYPLDPPFIVLATQNPYEFEGTYVLPESQLDRFMIRLRMGYPIRSEERKVLASHRDGRAGRVARPGPDRPTTCSGSSRAVRHVRVDDAIADYLLDIVHATRRSEDLHVGVSTRGALTLYRAAQSLALVSGRDYVVPDDVKTLAVPSWRTASSASRSSRPASSARPRPSSATSSTASASRPDAASRPVEWTVRPVEPVAGMDSV